MGIFEILAFLSFGIALIALWMVSDVLRKVGAQNDLFTRSQIMPLRAEIGGLDEKLTKVRKAIALLESHQKIIEVDLNSDKNTFDEKMKVIEDNFQALDKSIPQQYRTPASVSTNSIQ